jgi:signal transduction histidine kinase
MAASGADGGARASGALDAPRAEVLLQFERLLSHVSSTLIAASSAQMDARIEEALHAIVEFFGVDRSSLAELTPDSRNMILRATYGRPGVPLPLATNTAVGWPAPWYTQELLQGRVVRLARLSEAPPEASRERELAERYGVKANLSIPVFMQGRWSYALAVGSYTSEVDWPDDLVPRLRILAEMLAHAYEHSRAERERERLLEAAQRAIHVRDDFLLLAAHELRTPFTSLQLAVQALSRSGAFDQPGSAASLAARGFLATIERQVGNLNHLVDRLLDVLRIVGGELTAGRHDVDLSAVVRGVVTQLAQPLRVSGSTLTLDTPESVVGSWHRASLEQVVTHLVANAIKYGEGGPIEVVVRSQENEAQLVVQDHGIGIQVEEQARIFGCFERAVSSRHYGGLGLGLYIVQRIVEQLGGCVTCESAPREGSTFTVTVPRSAP